MNFFNQLLQQIMGGLNPVQLLMGILSQNMKPNNPSYNNLSNMVQHQDARGLEAYARNLAQTQGLDFDSSFADFKRKMGL